ncbi:MAG: SpoIID/LytB domain-containing protein [Clostridiaceae bacterium]|nr:SpoIID/LytB domain-containing protein [Clostridiaceae bacterium]
MYFKRLLAAVVFFMLIFCNASKVGFAYAPLPEKISIGIYYDKSAVASVDIGSSTGTEIGYQKEGKFVSLLSRESIKELVVRKDAYFVKTGNLVLEYSPDNPAVPEGKKFGPYHVQIEGDYEDYDLAMQQVNMLREKGINAFPAFVEGKFKIWAELCTSKQQAQELMAQIAEKTGDKPCTLIMPSPYRIQVLLPGQEYPMMVFESSALALSVQPLPGKGKTPLASINGKLYRGAVVFRRFTDSDMTVINTLGLEEYLYGVVPYEMPANWPLEALKAQAVAARTYAVLHYDKYSKWQFNLCPTTSSQVYGGYSGENANSTKAVQETKGKILTYDGKPALTYFFSTSGGHTEDIRNVWGGPEIPYLRGVKDPYEPTEEAPKGIWKVEITPQKVEELLRAKSIDIGNVLSIKPEEYSESGRVIKLRIVGTKGEHVLERQDTRMFFGANVIYSQCYTVTTSGDQKVYAATKDDVSKPVQTSGIKVISSKGLTSISPSMETIHVKGADKHKSYSNKAKVFVFEGRGYGHGVGLSQWGAKGMASKGFKYDEILLHYYPGTKVE